MTAMVCTTSTASGRAVERRGSRRALGARADDVRAGDLEARRQPLHGRGEPRRAAVAQARRAWPTPRSPCTGPGARSGAGDGVRGRARLSPVVQETFPESVPRLPVPSPDRELRWRTPSLVYSEMLGGASAPAARGPGHLHLPQDRRGARRGALGRRRAAGATSWSTRRTSASALSPVDHGPVNFLAENGVPRDEIARVERARSWRSSLCPTGSRGSPQRMERLPDRACEEARGGLLPLTTPRRRGALDEARRRRGARSTTATSTTATGS